MTDAAKYNQMFDYLSVPELPRGPEAVVVFGRNDPLVALAVGDLIVPSLVEIAVITGGVGKNTGDLLDQGYRSEAHFLETQLNKDAQKRGYTLPRVLLDEDAINGRDNARNSLGILSEHNVQMSSLTAVAHATSSRRLAETLKFEAEKRTGSQPTIHRKPSAYNFDPANPADRDEVAAELLRLADWPAKGLLGEQHDLPDDLVDFAREVRGNTPKPGDPWQSAILRRLPKRTQLRVIQSVIKHSSHTGD